MNEFRPFRFFTILFLATTFALLGSGCSDLLGSGENEIGANTPSSEEIPEAAPGDLPDDSETTSVEATISLNSIQPNRGSTEGGDLVEIIGWGFEDDPGAAPSTFQITFGPTGATCTQVQVISDTNIQCITPAYPLAEDVTVRILKAAEGQTPVTALLEGGFEYFAPVSITGIQPERGPSEGGTVVAIFGTGLIDGTTVRFDDSTPIEAAVVDAYTLTVSTPPLERGTYSVTVTNMNGTATLPAAFRTFDPVRLDAIEPFAGPIGGGTEATITGAGFVDPTALNVGSISTENTPNPFETEMAFVTPAANPPVEGPVDLVATNENGTDSLNNGFVYFDPDNNTPRIIALVPAASPLEGGITISLVVGGFTENIDTVLFGAAEAICNQLNPWQLTCEAPAADAEGAVDITVTAGDLSVTEIDAFQYIDLRLDSATPSVGAIAGGTRVEIQGNGFGADSRIFFDQREAAEVFVVNSQTIVARTPAAGSAGVVDVRVETWGIERNAEDFFTYFDPVDLNNWTGGGPIDGAVNITVVSTSGERVENAFVMMGALADPTKDHLYGYTDSRGQITISGLEVYGAQSFHAGKVGFGKFSWIETDAQNLTMQITPKEDPPPDPLPPCPEPTSMVPPLIRGDVYRIKDDFNTGADLVVVTTSYRTFSEQLPDPGPNSQLMSNGSYEIWARTGDMVLMALAGEITDEGTLDVHAMGFRPFVYTEASSGLACDQDSQCETSEECIDLGEGGVCVRVYEDMDIYVDTPLKQPLKVVLDNPPLQGVTSLNALLPTHAASYVWYDFGYMGLHMMGASVQPNTDTVYVDMPFRLPEAMDFATFNVDTSVGNSADGQIYPPRSDTRTYGLTDTVDPVVASPFLKTHTKISPTVSNALGPMNFEVQLLPETPFDVEPSANVHWMYNFETIIPCEGAMPIPRAIIHWFAISPGNNVQFDLPIFPQMGAGLNLPSDAYYWQLMALYSPNASYDELNVSSLFNWKSRALHVSNFSHTQ